MLTILVIVIVGGIVIGLILAIFLAPFYLMSQRQCPYCKELIPKDASACSHCGKDVEPVIRTREPKSD